MPQFLRQRYNPVVATTMAVFWLLLYIFVNLTSIIYLGALALDEAPHDVDRGVVAVEQGGRGDEPQRGRLGRGVAGGNAAGGTAHGMVRS